MEKRGSGHESFSAKKNLAGRVRNGDFTYPFGAYPEDGVPQLVGYDSKYLRGEGCFFYQIAVSHERIVPSFMSLLKLLPEEARLVVKVHSGDYYRDFDTYISAELVDREEMIDFMQSWEDVVFDDGFFGIGLFSDSESIEIFLDEHKTIHIYHHDPDLMEKILEDMKVPFVMDLKFFWDSPHYHEPLPLEGETSDGDYLTAFEDLADRYELFIDDDEDENNDDEGAPLGITCWRVDIRGYKPETPEVVIPQGFYSTVYLNAESRKEAVELVEEYLGSRNEEVDLYLQIARIPKELLTTETVRRNPDAVRDEPCVWYESERISFDFGKGGEG